MNFEELSPELKQKILACKTPEDIIKLANEEGYELSDDELRSVSGGGFWDSPFDCDDYVDKCPVETC